MNKIYFLSPDEKTTQLINVQDPNCFLGCHDYFTSDIATTYFYLKKAGLDCEVTNQIPAAGILLSDQVSLNKLLLKKSKYFGTVFKYPSNTLGSVIKGNAMLIVLKVDRKYHPAAHINIVSNPLDFEKNRNSIWNPYCLVSIWPQPGLIPRLKERNCLVENVAYLGHKSQLAEELKSDRWRDALSSLGCNWLPIFDPKQWGDYRHIDLVITARSFDNNPYINKPANKLINCWRTGVPAIVTPESAILAERKTELDFLMVNSLEEAILAVKKLKSDSDLYAKMVSNGIERAKNFTAEKGLERLLIFFNDFAFPAYEKWKKLTENQKKVLFIRRCFKFSFQFMLDTRR